MSKRMMHALKCLLVFTLLLPLLAACGGISIKDTYPLESVTKNGAETSYVYRADGQTVPELAKQMANDRKPDQMSEEDPDRMFLVYSKEIVHLQKDPENPSNTLIEVSSKEYVKQNYASDFLQGYLTAVIIGNIFDSLSGSKGYGSYRGYSTKDTYKPKTEYRPATEQDKKAIPPMTVNKTGSITKRSSTSSSSTSSDKSSKSSIGSIFKKDSSSSSTSSSSGSTGKIIRNGSSSSSSSSKSSGSITSKSSKSSSSSSVKTKTAPKTKSGVGSITRRK